MSRQRPRRPRVESLEGRALLSVVVAESESNNRMATADVIPLGTSGSVEIDGRLGGRSDRDFFSVTAPASGSLAVSPSTAVGASVRLDVFDRLGRPLLQDKSLIGVGAVGLNVQAGQRYYLRFRSVAGGPADYSVLVSLGPPIMRVPPPNGGGGNSGGGGGSTPPGGTGGVFPETEGNNSPATATPFTLGTGRPARLVGTSYGLGDVDYFVFTAPKSGTLTIDIASTPLAPTDLAIQNTATATLLSVSGGRKQGTLAVVAGASYYVRLVAPLNAISTYQVDLNLI